MEDINVKLLADLILDVKKDLSDVKKDVSDLKDISHANTISLDQHMSRNDISEARLDVQEEKLEKFVQDMEPVREHVKTVHLLTGLGVKILKVLGIVVSIVGTIAGLLRLR